MTNKIEIPLDVSGGDRAESQVANLERRVTELSKSLDQQNKRAARGAKVAAGSYQALEKELKDNVKELKRLEVGSKAFTAQKRKVDQLARSVANANTQIAASTTAGNRFSASVGAGITQVGQLAAGFVGLQAGISAVVQELEKAKQVQLRAAQQELTFEAALANIGLNIGGDQVDRARQLIETNAPELNTTQEGLANLIGVAISAGAKDLEEAMKVSAAGLEATVGDATAASELVQTALDITSLSGSDNFRGALGQVAQTQAQVRSVNASEFFTNIGPALAAATADRANLDGISTERALEVSSVISQVLKDRTGANTATAVRQFVTRLDSFVPELSATLKDGSKAKLTREQISQFQQSRSIDERIELFRQNDALARQFLDQQKEGIGKGAIAELIQGSTRAIEIEKKAAAGIGSLSEAEGAFDSLVRGVSSATTLLRAERESIAGLEQFQTGDTTALQGQVRTVMTRVLDNVNLPGLDSAVAGYAQTALTAANDAGRDPTAEVIEFLKDLKNSEGGLFSRQLSAQEKRFVETQIAVLERIEKAVSKPPVVIRQNAPRPNPPPATAVP